MPIKYDPNKYFKNTDKEWLTYVPTRYPRGKLHASRAGALSSLNYRGWGLRRGGYLFKRIEGRWYPVLRVKNQAPGKLTAAEVDAAVEKVKVDA